MQTRLQSPSEESTQSITQGEKKMKTAIAIASAIGIVLIGLYLAGPYILGYLTGGRF